VEEKFEDEKHFWKSLKMKNKKCEVIAFPLIQLTYKPNARIENIGNPKKLIVSLGFLYNWK